MRDPIPYNRELLKVLLKSQLERLAVFTKIPFEKSKDKDIFWTRYSDFDSPPIEELRAFAYRNAVRILNLILSEPLTGSF